MHSTTVSSRHAPPQALRDVMMQPQEAAQAGTGFQSGVYYATPQGVGQCNGGYTVTDMAAGWYINNGTLMQPQWVWLAPDTWMPSSLSPVYTASHGTYPGGWALTPSYRPVQF